MALTPDQITWLDQFDAVAAAGEKAAMALDAREMALQKVEQEIGAPR